MRVVESATTPDDVERVLGAEPVRDAEGSLVFHPLPAPSAEEVALLGGAAPLLTAPCHHGSVINLAGLVAGLFLYYVLVPALLVSALVAIVAGAARGRRSGLRCAAISIAPLVLQAVVVLALLAFDLDEVADQAVLPAPIWLAVAVAVEIVGWLRPRKREREALVAEWDLDDPDPF